MCRMMSLELLTRLDVCFDRLEARLRILLGVSEPYLTLKLKLKKKNVEIEAECFSAVSFEEFHLVLRNVRRKKL